MLDYKNHDSAFGSAEHPPLKWEFGKRSQEEK